MKRDVGHAYGATNAVLRDDNHPCLPGIPDDEVDILFSALADRGHAQRPVVPLLASPDAPTQPTRRRGVAKREERHAQLRHLGQLGQHRRHRAADQR